MNNLHISQHCSFTTGICICESTAYVIILQQITVLTGWTLMLAYRSEKVLTFCY